MDILSGLALKRKNKYSSREEVGNASSRIKQPMLQANTHWLGNNSHSPLVSRQTLVRAIFTYQFAARCEL